MSSFLAINGIACLAAIWFAGHHSIDARSCATAIFLGWLFYITAWLPDGYTPTQMIYAATDIKMKSPQLWSLCDCLVGLYIAHKAFPRWWAVTLWALLTVQCIFHIMRLNQLIDFGLYSSILDKIFIIQIAVFLVLGWPNVRIWLTDMLDRWRHVPDPSQSTSGKAQKVSRNGRP